MADPTCCIGTSEATDRDANLAGASYQGAINGTGTGMASVLAIDGTLDVTFTGCDGLDVQPPGGNHLTLTKDRSASFSGP